MRNSYYKFQNSHVIEINPLGLYIDVVKKRGDQILGDFINGTLFYPPSMISISTLVQDGKILAEQGLHDNVKRGTLVIYKDGTVNVEMIDFISRHKNLKDIKCAIGGYNLIPNVSMKEQLKLEWFDYNSVGYKTWHSMLGYSKSKNKILVVIALNFDAEQCKKLMKDLGCDCGIGLDGGGSTCGRFDGKLIRSTTRVIHNIIRWL